MARKLRTTGLEELRAVLLSLSHVQVTWKSLKCRIWKSGAGLRVCISDTFPGLRPMLWSRDLTVNRRI